MTNANDEQSIQYGLDRIPYNYFTLKYIPAKKDPKYYEILFAIYQIQAKDVLYIEHNIEAVNSARSVGITTLHYDKDKKDIIEVKEFLGMHL